jgi:hypothetical protein
LGTLANPKIAEFSPKPLVAKGTLPEIAEKKANKNTFMKLMIMFLFIIIHRKDEFTLKW